MSSLAQAMRRRPKEAWACCSGVRTTACDPHNMVGDQCEQRPPDLHHSARQTTQLIFLVFLIFSFPNFPIFGLHQEGWMKASPPTRREGSDLFRPNRFRPARLTCLGLTCFGQCRFRPTCRRRVGLRRVPEGWRPRRVGPRRWRMLLKNRDLGLHTTAREPKRAHFRAPALQTPPKFNERTPTEKQKEQKWGGRGEKKREISSDNCCTIGHRSDRLIVLVGIRNFTLRIRASRQLSSTVSGG